ncbi:MAG: aminotransferase class I/II-fold pyridoxal phosphate-dependent enzyme [Acidimicrobiia bacterium]|jgi:aspartate/methionine/tyrosine aminotransferase
MDDPLSRRGRRLIDDSRLAAYIAVNLARGDDRYEPTLNPDGYVALCTAENKLVWDLLGPKLLEAGNLPHRALGYDDMTGTPGFRRRVAGFIGRTVFGRPVDPDAVVVLAGAGTVLEALFHAIADPGDAVLVPTPSYSGFWLDLETRDALSIIPVHTAPQEGFRLTTDLLDRALRGTDRPVRALLFTSPDNPLGRVYSATEVDEVLDWCDRNGLHVVVDEIYALSVFGDRPFTSAGSRRPDLGDRTHVVWGFSKDFGMSGLRCGVLVCESADVRAAVAAQSYWGAVSGATQHLLAAMLADTAWVDGYLSEMRSRLGTAHAAVCSALDEHRIPHLRSSAGHFLLCDLRSHLDEPTWAAEDRLWRRLLDGANVNLTPGSACRVSEPGFFRLCFAAASRPTVVEGVRRLAATVGGGGPGVAAHRRDG